MIADMRTELKQLHIKTVMKAMFLALLFTGIAALVSGCATSGGDQPDGCHTLPWNTPADWENGSIGVPY